MKRAAASAALGAVLLLCAATFAVRSMYIPGIAFLALGVGFAIQVTLASAGARLERETGPATVEEDAPWMLRLIVTPGLIPAPGGEVVDPLLKAPVRFSQLRRGRDGRRRGRAEIRFGRRGRRVLEPPRLVIRDPLGLAVRTIEAEGPAVDVLVLPRIEPVVPVEGGAPPGRRAAAARGATAAARAARPRPRWSSTCCGRTGRACPRPASIGQRWRGPES